MRLTVTPRGAHARLEIRDSRGVVLNGVQLRGGTTLRANGVIRSSSNVRIHGGTFTRCGEGRTPEAGYCLLLRETNGVEIRSSRFHDCYGCDFLHGVDNRRLTIRTSTFHRARLGRCGRSIEDCHHQDLVHLMRGGPIVIDRNVFGLNQYPGAAQVYVNGAVRGLTITNNLFLGSDPSIPGSRVYTSLWIGNRLDLDPPRDVLIAHNTILGGRTREPLSRETENLRTSIFFPHAYDRIPLEDRPVVANNVIKLLRSPHRKCPFVRAFSGNVVIDGVACAPGNEIGDPRLDPEGRPTAEVDPSDRPGRRSLRDARRSPGQAAGRP